MNLAQILEENKHLTWAAENFVGTDKGGYPGEHDYVKGFYDKEFARYQDKEISLLEIGIFGGASLVLWSKYFEKGNIIGIDIQDNVPDKYKNIDRVTHIIKDAYTYEVAESLGKFDIVIDDGPHTLDSMIQCIRLYLDKVNDGGILVIEDVQDVEWFDILKDNVPEKYQNGIECIDIRENMGRWDDLLFVIRK
jgi:precorrin-6B methylase 2